MKTIVITGSTRGMGLGLAEAFLKLGGQVMLNGRTEAAIDKALSQLHGKYGHGRVLGRAGDVQHVEQVEALWAAATSRFGRVDIWINNAGLSHLHQPLWELPSARLGAVVGVNVAGAVHGAAVAARGMLQQGGGHIYFVDDWMPPGGSMLKTIPYGVTRRAVGDLARALTRDLRHSPVKVSVCDPGLVITELWAEQYVGLGQEWERAKRQANIFGDRVETVAPYLAEKIWANERHGARIAWLTPTQMVRRWLQARFRPRDLFSRP